MIFSSATAQPVLEDGHPEAVRREVRRLAGRWPHADRIEVTANGFADDVWQIRASVNGIHLESAIVS